MARNRLEEAGIRTMLNNEEAAATGLQLPGNATIELLVYESDIEAAREALLYQNLSLEEAASERPNFTPRASPNQVQHLHPTGITTPDTVEEEGEPTDPYLEKIDRAFKAVLLGMLFFRWSFYAFYLLGG